jgi:hypothetical protein
VTDKWLRCQIAKGMFSDEKAVTYSSRDGTKISVFVPEKFVEPISESTGRVKVSVFTKGSQTWAVLPNDSRDEVLVGNDDIS